MAYVQIAFCHLQMKDVEKYISMNYDDNDCRVLQNMKRAIGCGNNKAQVQNHYSEVLMQIGQYGEAEATIKKAIDLDDKWPYSYINYATYVLQVKQDYLSAANYFKKALKVDPGCVTAMIQLAQLHMVLQEFDEATEILEKALKEAITENDIKQVCSLQISMEYQVNALEDYQQMLKNEGVN